MRRLRPLGEAECYTRLYRGWEPTVTVIRPEEGAAGQEAHSPDEGSGRRPERRLDGRLEGPAEEAA